MGARINYMPGQKIGECIFIEEVETTKRDRHAKFLCQCGNEFIGHINRVVAGHTTSCGCGIIRNKRQSKPIISQFRAEYNTWIHIKMRCLNPKNQDYKYYGGRGIKVCDRWLESFDNFLEDMGPRPSKKHSVDRKEVNGDYTPDNCKWATTKEQARNRRDNKWLTYKGETKLLTDWAKHLKISHTTLINRIKRGNPVDKIFSPMKFGRNGKPRPSKVRLVITFGVPEMQ